MTTPVPIPKKPVKPRAVTPSAKPWTVAVQFEDQHSEAAQKLRALSAVFGKKPGPYLAEIVLDWLATIDISTYEQEELFIDRAS